MNEETKTNVEQKETTTKTEVATTSVETEVNKEPKLKITTKSSFSTIIDSASSIVGEAKIQFAEAGMRIAGMDPANVCMIDLRLSKEEFINYDVENDPEITINILDLKKILKNLGDKEITIELMNGYITITKGRKRFTMPLLENLENELKKVPQLEYSSYFVPNKSIKEDLKILYSLKNSITFKLKEQELVLVCKGNVNNATFDAEGQVVDFTETQTAKFSEEYLIKMFGWKQNITKIEIKTDYPLRVTYDYGVCILAPRIEND